MSSDTWWDRKFDVYEEIINLTVAALSYGKLNPRSKEQLLHNIISANMKLAIYGAVPVVKAYEKYREVATEGNVRIVAAFIDVIAAMRADLYGEDSINASDIAEIIIDKKES